MKRRTRPGSRAPRSDASRQVFDATENFLRYLKVPRSPDLPRILGWSRRWARIVGIHGTDARAGITRRKPSGQT